MTLNDIAALTDKIEYQIAARNLSVRYALFQGFPVSVYTDYDNDVDIIVDMAEVHNRIQKDEKLPFRFQLRGGKRFSTAYEKPVAAAIRNVEQIIAYQFELGLFLKPIEYDNRIVLLGWHADYGMFVWDDDYLYDCYENDEGSIVVEAPSEEELEADELEEMSEETGEQEVPYDV